MQHQAIAGFHQVSLAPHESSHQHLAVELVGPAGSGKSTLRALLCQADDFHQGGFPSSWESARHLPRTTLAMLPSYLRRQPGRCLTWAELRSMLYLRAWLLNLRSARHPGVTLYDQGPVFRLSVLREFGPPAIAAVSFQKWLRSALEAWSQALHLVVWLDAPNETLVTRIGQRTTQQHVCQKMSDGEACALLDRYRDGFESVIAEMQEIGTTRVLRLSSAERTPEAMARDVREELWSIADE